jgi:hypothetical protein
MGSKVPDRQKPGSAETISRISLFAYLTPEELSDINKLFSKNAFQKMKSSSWSRIRRIICISCIPARLKLYK